MSVKRLENYALGRWQAGEGALIDIASAVDGSIVSQIAGTFDGFESAVRFAREQGMPALQKMTLHERAYVAKGLATALNERKEELYELNKSTGATRADGWIDIEGGAMTLSSVSSKTRRELPDDYVIMDGNLEGLSRSGSWMGQHIYTSRKGVSLHINAYNFPVWGMLEKLGPALIAGMPVIVKPATPTAYLCEHAVRIMIETGLLPDGALQLIVGSAGNVIDYLEEQDVISFTGSAMTAGKLKSHPNILEKNIRFIVEQDSLNATVLGSDISQGDPEFDAFISEIVTEMTTKAGQKCTAIRRIFVPENSIDTVQTALVAKLNEVSIGHPDAKETQMGALVSLSQRDNVLANLAELAKEASIVFDGREHLDIRGADAQAGAFLPPILLRNDAPNDADAVHNVEAFGPVATLMPYQSVEDVVGLVNKGRGSLVASVFTYDGSLAREFILSAGAFHGRLAIINRDNIKDNTGHGSPLPMLIHGGPGRAGGSEEMGGVRGVKHYMQRSVVQGSPDILTAATNSWTKGAATDSEGAHPFRLSFNELELGKTLTTEAREISLEDIEHFAHFTGDTFYAHMDQEAAEANPFFGGRVAHGYLILSFAAGLFVDPAPGPVLANYGLDNLRFLSPVKPGDVIQVRLTAKSKKQRNAEYGEVKWDVEVTKDDGSTAATYELLTMNAIGE